MAQSVREQHGQKEIRMSTRTCRFTIDRRDGSRSGGRYELTTVGRNGQTNTHRTDNEGRDGHFTDERQYRRAIDRAVEKNS